MSTIDKIKKIVFIVLGLSLSAYLIYSGFEILNQEEVVAPKSIESK